MNPLAELLDTVRQRVDARLLEALDELASYTKGCAEEALPVVSASKDLTMRGGKRLRPALVVAAVEAVRPWEPIAPAVIDVACAVEVLQSYLLVHDDWMDNDTVRRGGPTVHVSLARAYGSTEKGAVTAVLGGDLLSSLAQELCSSSKIEPARLHAVLAAFTRMQREVVLGQTLDVLDTSDVDAVHDLKTGSYTVRGPLALGHAVAGGSAEAWAAMAAFAKPLGIAFQIRDDLIGTFGDEKETGKSSSNDLRQGKRTAPVRYALEHLSGADRATLEGLLGRDEDLAVLRARALVEQAGTRAAMEERIAVLRAESLAALKTDALRSEGAALLAGFATVLTERKH